MEREVERFTAVSDDGQRHTIIAMQEMIEVNAVGQHTWIKGLKRMQLPDGSPVNYIDPNTFQIVHTDLIVRKVN
jgi:hypothetical protein